MSQKTPFLSSRRSIKLDSVHPRDYLRHKLVFACEDCSHFAPKAQKCTLGFNCNNHLRATQQKEYILSGRMALCRFHEID